MTTAIINIEGLVVEFKDIFIFALKLFAEKNISFTDAFNASIMKSKGITKIYSYDADFDKIDKIKRIEPQKIGSAFGFSSSENPVGSKR